MARRNKRNTRQRMINLMYLVFIAMLAINYPEEVIDSFELIKERLQATLENTEKRNAQIYNELNLSYEMAPEKTASAHEKSRAVSNKSDSLFQYINFLKQEIADKSDGKGADIDNIVARDNLDASSVVMLGPNGHGKKLRLAIQSYRDNIVEMIADSSKQDIIRNSLSTQVSKKRKRMDNANWEQASFEAMPSIATITFLTEVQSNIRQAEGEVLSTIIKEIDIADLRVNKLEAFVVPSSKIVMRGTNYEADIILAAVDSTQRPKIVVNGNELAEENGSKFVSAATTLGKNKISGFISMMSRDGNEIRKEFSEEFTVIEPMVTVAPLLMDVLYANYDNPLSISVPGVVRENISASATGGSLVAKGAEWIAKPSKVGQNMVINVSIRGENGRTQTLSKTFRVRQLPDPAAYIEFTDNTGTVKHFKRGAISKSAVLSASGIKAALDDGILNVPFTVTSFRTFQIDAMGNIAPEMSNGANFSARQLDQIKKVTRGKTMFIASIMVIGPDGTQREIPPMELRIN